eukprot:CAMPEP_0170455416 /NCGR_PEP_ID=MMETSP0123-20130129/3386_1 /TAXON_ID=182087 /ORGANISM="Favella ehrenbergii, Strain Fehren 1" /LENGTH=104 /DNA_ID=CAMNT_0010718543 /DNA_START=324 /DNA_END=638 /DNA_ORIENTATION=+
MPTIADKEEDPLAISFRDLANPFFNIYAVPESIGAITGATKYKMMSDPIREAYVKEGTSSVVARWTDTATGIVYETGFGLQVLSNEEYYDVLGLNGTIAPPLTT